MYNSRRVSRTGRTIQRRKVDTGITIDPTKVRAYMEYLLHNGYVQLPQPAPSPDGTYLLVPNADLDVSHLLSSTVYADEFIASVLAIYNIFLKGTETVYMKLETELDIDNESGYVLKIINADPSKNYNKGFSLDPVYSSFTKSFVFIFIFCNGLYSIALQSFNGQVNEFTGSFTEAQSKRTFLKIDDNDSTTFVNPKVTLVSVGSE